MSPVPVVLMHGMVLPGMDGPGLILRDSGLAAYDSLAVLAVAARDVASLARVVGGAYERWGPVVLAGYSEGGSMAFDLLGATDPGQVLGLVVYEGYAKGPPPDGSDEPVLFIRNTRGRGRVLPRPRRIMAETISRWSDGRRFDQLTGEGGHIDWRRFGHDWDRSLNPQIADWIYDRAGEL